MRIACVFLCLLGCACTRRDGGATSWPVSLSYPATRRVDANERFHDRVVLDPYRWLEALESKEVRAWVAAQNSITQTSLQKLEAEQRLRARVTELVRFESFGVPTRRAGHMFWRYNDGQQDQPQIMHTAADDAAPTSVLDFNQLSDQGQWVGIGYLPSDDGSLLAYGLSEGGGDWQRWRVREVASGKDLPDELSGIKYYRPVFSADGKAIYYSRFPTPAAGLELVARDENCKLYRHRLGTPRSADTIVYQRPDQPTWQFSPALTRDGRYLVVTISDGELGDRRQEQLVYFDLQQSPNKPVPLIDRFDAEYVFLGNEGPVFYVLTTLQADTKRILAIDTRKPGREHWREVVPAGREAIDEAALIGHQLLVTTLRDAHSALTAYDLNGKPLREAELPGLGTVVGLNGGPDETAAFYAYTSFTEPRTVYRYDLETGHSTRWKSLHVAFDVSAFAVQQVFYPSRDGTRIPMFIAQKAAAPSGEERPTLLTAYGGGGVPLTPWFDPAMIAWMERGGLFAVANVRGGGEYGEAWHQAAVRERKQVGVDDLIAGAQYLIDQHYTSSARLGATGTSNGAILVSAATLQKPGLFGAVVPLAGLYDLPRSRLFGEGIGWEAEFGSVNDAREFAALLALSPLHAVREHTAYPPFMIVTSDHDVRVAPFHSYKFAATLQASQSAKAPVLLRVWSQTGHGKGNTLSQRVEQNTEVLSFFGHALGLSAD